MFQPKYDTLEGIKGYLNNLTGLNKLKSERSEAYYSRKEKLNNFIVLGRYSLDTCGNFSKIVNDDGYNIVPIQAIPNCPDVMTWEQMNAKIGGEASICSTISDLPPDYVKCSICEIPWAISNAYDCISKHNTEVIDASPFIGAKLSNITKIPKYIDVTPHRVSHDTVRPKTLSKGSELVDKDYIIKDGDSIFVSVCNYKHTECDQLNIIQYGLKNITETIINTDILDSYFIGDYNLIMIKNQYHSAYKEPWYRLQFKTYTGEHEILIGWRKSVIHIGWEKSGKDLLHLFDSENVTKGKYMIHAHGYEKATVYLKKIITHL